MTSVYSDPALSAPSFTAEPMPEPAHASSPRWGHPRRILFRFGSLYLLLYFLPFPLTAIGSLTLLPVPFSWVGDGANYLVYLFANGLLATDVWFGEHILRLAPGSIIIQPTGSGDTLLGYVQSALFGILALAGTLAWSALDRKRPAYPRLAEFLRVFLRYALAGTMLSYGLAKIPPMQFQPPGPDRLLRSLGQFSPMGLLWTFMGFSPAYTMFAGAAETLGALLLLWRRTTTLGALVLAAVLLNVVMLNFCYDVPVKLYSLHLLAASLVLLLPALPRLMAVLVLNRATTPAVFWRPFASRWKTITLKSAKAAFVLLLVGTHAWTAYQGWLVRGLSRPNPPLFGIYEVEEFRLSGEPRPPLTTDKDRWRRFFINRTGAAIIQDMSDGFDRWTVTYDAAAGTLKLQTAGAAPQEFVLTCTVSPDDHLTLDGPYKSGPIHVTLKRIPESSLTLTSRGFHWIQELPFNR
jgi:hypothetical protein